MKFLPVCLLSFSLLAAQEDSSYVIGVGIGTIDLSVQVDDAFIEKHVKTRKGIGGYCTPEMMDDVLAKTGLTPRPVSGGSAANTIRALSKLGHLCAFLGPVGTDDWGVVFCNNLKGFGVHLRPKEAAFTARVLCLVSPEGQRTFMGINPQVEDIPLSKEDLRGAKWLHFEARNLMNKGFIEKSMMMASELGLKVSMDLSSVNVVEEYKEILIHLISNYVEITFCNEDEIVALTDLNPEAGCLKLQQMCPVAVVTLGEKGCLVGHRGTVTTVSSFPSKVIDTTGAGDYFAAGFLYSYFRNESMEECGRMGNRLGSAITEVIGTELSQENWKKIYTSLGKSQ